MNSFNRIGRKVETLNAEGIKCSDDMVFATEKDAIAFLSFTESGMPVDKAISKIKARVRSRENAKARNDAMRSIGMKRTPYGWE